MNENIGKITLIQEIEDYLQKLDFKYQSNKPLILLQYADLQDMRDTLKEKIDEAKFHSY